MKRKLLLLSLITYSIMLLAQSDPWTWAVSAGSNSINGDSGWAIAKDTFGHNYVTGGFTGTAVFGTTYLTSGGYKDVFVSKIDVNGNYIWTVQAGGTGSDEGLSITTDSAGNCYVTGSFRNAAIFGNTTIYSVDDCDVFIAKLDCLGNWIWVKRLGGLQDDTGHGVAVDNAGNCFVTGSYVSPAFYAGNTLEGTGEDDIFIAKIDTSGTWLWVKHAGGTGYDEGFGISTDTTGNCYCSGSFYDVASFGDITLSSDQDWNIFVCKLDPDGDWIWVTQAGGETSEDRVYDISTDDIGNSYVTGMFTDTASFGGTNIISNGGYSEVFVAKLDADGDWLWAKQAGGTDFDNGRSITSDSYGNCYITGDFAGESTFGDTTLVCDGYSDIFVCSLDTNGNWLWAFQAGGPSSDRSMGIDVGNNGSCCITGSFSYSTSFGDNTLSSSGGMDIFVSSLGSISTPKLPENLSIEIVENCGILSWDAVTESVFNVPITPDGYFLFCNDSSNPFGDYSLLVVTTNTQYSHELSGLDAHSMFYKVKTFNNLSPDVLNNMHRGMSESDVLSLVK